MMSGKADNRPGLTSHQAFAQAEPLHMLRLGQGDLPER